MNREIDELLEGMFEGEEASLAQLMSLVGTDGSSIPEIMGRISSRLGNSYQFGITGSQGEGKSTLVSPSEMVETSRLQAKPNMVKC